MSTEPNLTLRDHNSHVWCVAFSPDGRRIASGSIDFTVIISDVLTGKAIGRPLQHGGTVCGVTFSPDNKRIVSAVADKTLRIWDALTGNALGYLAGHTAVIRCVVFSPDGQRIASGSDDKTARIWDVRSGKAIGPPLVGHTGGVYSIAWFPDGRRVATGSVDRTIRIWDSMTGKQIGAPLEGHTNHVLCVAVSVDGRRIVSSSNDRTLRVWDTVTGKTRGSPLRGHTNYVRSVAFSPDGILIVSASDDKTIRVWNGITGEAIGSPIQAHDNDINCVAFSPDGNRIASGSDDNTVKLWDSATVEALSLAKLPQFTIRIDDDPSILAHVSDAILQWKQGELDAAMQRFDLAIALSSSSPTSVRSVCSVLAIKAIVLFGAGKEETAIARVDDLIRMGPRSILWNASFQMIKAYMLNELAQRSFERGMYDRVVQFLTEAIRDDLSRTMDTYYKYRARIPADRGLALVKTLFGWEFEGLRYTINQNLCEALHRIGRSKDASDAVENMGRKLRDDEQERYKQWSASFKHECAIEWSASGDQALEQGHYDAAIEQYSGCIALNPWDHTLYTNRSLAYASKHLWQEALDDADQAIKLAPSLTIAYKRKYRALHGAERYDEAIVALKVFVQKSNTNSNNQYAFPHHTEAKINHVASDTLKNMPTRLFDTTSGILCDHDDILRKFKDSKPYKQLVSSITTRDELVRGDSINLLVNSYFQYAMLSHRWEDGEIRLQDIGQGESVHEMKSNSPGLVKLQKLCTIASGLGLLWAWSDTCCIDKTNSVELQESITLMYQWYSGSAVTIAYLSDVKESSSTAFIDSKWFTRGWTLQELLAPPVIMFYKRDWSLFWHEDTSDAATSAHDAMPHGQAVLMNHKQCEEILKLIEQVTGIDVETLRPGGFQPGMHDTRQKLRWASHRQTTKVEDAAYSLFGMFDIHLSVTYGEKDKALSRLLQEIIGQTGELAVLDWVGQRGKAHSCLPLNMTSFRLTQWVPPLLSDTEIAAQVSSLRNSLLPEDIDKLAEVRKRIHTLPVPRFQQNRLGLPCIVYPVQAVTQHSQAGGDRKVPRYTIKATGLKGFDIQTAEKMHEGSEARPSQQKYFVAHIMRDDILEQLMKVPEDEATGVFEMIVALSRPFLPFLLLQRGKTYQRIAARDDISTEVEDMMAVRAEGLEATTLEVV